MPFLLKKQGTAFVRWRTVPFVSLQKKLSGCGASKDPPRPQALSVKASVTRSGIEAGALNLELVTLGSAGAVGCTRTSAHGLLEPVAVRQSSAVLQVLPAHGQRDVLWLGAGGVSDAVANGLDGNRVVRVDPHDAVGLDPRGGRAAHDDRCRRPRPPGAGGAAGPERTPKAPKQNALGCGSAGGVPQPRHKEAREDRDDPPEAPEQNASGRGEPVPDVVGTLGSTTVDPAAP
eukprot:SAG11_NODE_2292_length_3556_cov_4.475557_2_plen_232_part_00